MEDEKKGKALTNELLVNKIIFRWLTLEGILLSFDRQRFQLDTTFKAHIYIFFKKYSDILKDEMKNKSKVMEEQEDEGSTQDYSKLQMKKTSNRHLKRRFQITQDKNPLKRC